MDSVPSDKEEERRQLQRAVDAWLAKGNKITVVPGFRSDPLTEDEQHRKPTEQFETARKRAHLRFSKKGKSHE